MPAIFPENVPPTKNVSPKSDLRQAPVRAVLTAGTPDTTGTPGVADVTVVGVVVDTICWLKHCWFQTMPSTENVQSGIGFDQKRAAYMSLSCALSCVAPPPPAACCSP